MWTICKIKSFENKFILERLSPRGQILSCLVQCRRINGELGRLGFHSRLCHSMREEPAQTSAPHPCLPTLLVPPWFPTNNTFQGQWGSWKGIAQAWESSGNWNLLFKYFSDWHLLPSFQECWKRGNAHLPCLYSWMQGGWRRELPAEDLCSEGADLA